VDKITKIYEWSVVSLALLILTLTGAGLWLQFLDGQVVNVPVLFNDPHPYTHPVDPHLERPVVGGVTHQTTAQNYKPGEIVYAYVDVIKSRPEPGKLQWQLMDQRFYPYVAREGVLPIGHHHQVVAIERVPLHVPPGQYHFAGTVTYSVNFLKDVHIPLRTNCFQVVEGEK
jgi:hypothetical protein